MDTLAKLINGKCYICDRGTEVVICEKCFNKLEPEGKVTSKKHRYLFKYNEIASKILLMSKYSPYNFYILKHLISRAKIDLEVLPNSLLCPIPISSLKRFERKFNQAELISVEFSKKLKIPSLELLYRKRDSAPLFSLDIKRRQKELKDIFESRFFTKWLLSENPDIILVDDLKTTGETLSQAEKALIKRGFKNITFLTLFST